MRLLPPHHLHLEKGDRCSHRSHPAAVRFAANPHTHQLYAAIDVALSRHTAEPGAAHLGLVLFRHDPAWGFRLFRFKP